MHAITQIFITCNCHSHDLINFSACAGLIHKAKKSNQFTATKELIESFFNRVPKRWALVILQSFQKSHNQTCLAVQCQEQFIMECINGCFQPHFRAHRPKVALRADGREWGGPLQALWGIDPLDLWVQFV